MADNSLPKQPGGRGVGRQFAPGESGNPGGRKPGTRARATVFGEAILQRDADAIIEAVVEAAKAGDPTAMRLCVERLVPLRRGRAVVFPLPRLLTAADVGDAMAAVAAAMARGELTPDEATAVAGVIELRRRSIETTELEQRLSNLERISHDKSN